MKACEKAFSGIQILTVLSVFRLVLDLGQIDSSIHGWHWMNMENIRDNLISSSTFVLETIAILTDLSIQPCSCFCKKTSQIKNDISVWIW